MADLITTPGASLADLRAMVAKAEACHAQARAKSTRRAFAQ
jgi:hypothetical protein